MKDMAAVILAAGKGTRMKSDKAKVLHEISGSPMIQYVVETALAVVPDVLVVVGYQGEQVRKALVDYPMLRFAIQEEQLGTGHAVMTALLKLDMTTKDVVVLCGDTPLIRKRTLHSLINKHKEGAKMLTLLTTKMGNPSGYGRILLDSEGNVCRIVEESDASEEQRNIKTVNTGTYCINVDFLKMFLPTLDADNAQGEFYLTDIVQGAYQDNVPAYVIRVEDSFEVLGVNTKKDLAIADGHWSIRARERGD